MKGKYFKILIALFFVFFGWAGWGHAAFTDVSHGLEGTYSFSGTGPGPGPFTFSVAFDLWQDTGLGQYEYRYTITNLDDPSNAALQSLTIFTPYALTGAGTFGYIPGAGVDPDTIPTPGSSVFFPFPSPSFLPELGTSDVLFYRSLFGPAAGVSAFGDASAGFSASGTLPGPSSPVPEPGTLILLGVGLVGLAGGAKMKFGKKL